MEFFANHGKNIEREVDGKVYLRSSVKTHFVDAGKDDYNEFIRRYIGPVHQEGDIVAISENIIALCQNRIYTLDQMKVSRLAKFLASKINVTSAGLGLGNPYKMEMAIQEAGRLRILFAAACHVVARLFGKKGVFYTVAGHGIAGIDGFCNISFDYYMDKGVLVPEDSDGVCDEIKAKTGISCMVVDANDLDVEILGKCRELDKYSNKFLADLIRDNPNGQADQMTPLTLIREKALQTEPYTVTVREALVKRESQFTPVQ